MISVFLELYFVSESAIHLLANLPIIEISFFSCILQYVVDVENPHLGRS